MSMRPLFKVQTDFKFLQQTEALVLRFKTTIFVLFNGKQGLEFGFDVCNKKHLTLSLYQHNTSVGDCWPLAVAVETATQQLTAAQLLQQDSDCINSHWTVY